MGKVDAEVVASTRGGGVKDACGVGAEVEHYRQGGPTRSCTPTRTGVRRPPVKSICDGCGDIAGFTPTLYCYSRKYCVRAHNCVFSVSLNVCVCRRMVLRSGGRGKDGAASGGDNSAGTCLYMLFLLPAFRNERSLANCKGVYASRYRQMHSFHECLLTRMSCVPLSATRFGV